MCYAVVLCVLFYLACRQSFDTWGLYDCGTVVFVGLLNSLQMKVAFFHHQWAWPNIFVMALSLFGMMVYFLIIAAAEYEYYYIANRVYLQPLFWFYGFVSVPVMVVMVDWIPYYTRLVFWPTIDMVYKEVELKVSANILAVKKSDNVQSMSVIGVRQ